MTKLKPVWRMNTGNGVPSDFKSGFLYMDGSLFCCDDVATMPKVYFSLEPEYSESDVSAYETNRTRAAKFERVACDSCGDNRFRGMVFCGGYFEYRECPECNGRGMVRRKINGN